MRTMTRGLRKTLSPLTASVMLVLSVAVPVLDADRAATSPVLESEHTPGRCVVGHDHRLCTQAGSSRALPSARATLALPTPGMSETVASPRPALHPRLDKTGHAPRAPPLT